MKPVWLLMALLIIVAYNMGASRVLGAGAGAGTSLLYAATGRNAAGNFVNYPS